jgi:hypothetical protein
METREVYRQKYEARIKEWDAKIRGLKAQAQDAVAQAKIDLSPHLETVHRTFERVKAKAQGLAHATDDKWEDTKRDADAAWNDLKSSVDRVLDALKPDHNRQPRA